MRGAAVRAAAVQRRLDGSPDPFALYAVLSEGGRRADTALFEGGDGTTLLMERAAVRAECRGDEVTLLAIGNGGGALLAGTAACLAENLVSSAPDRLVLRFPPSVSEEPEERLRAPSPFDALRALTQVRLDEGEPPFAVTALGVVGFEYAALREELGDSRDDPLGFPDFLFWIPETLLLFARDAAPRLICTGFSADDPEALARSRFEAAGRIADVLHRCEVVEPPPRCPRPDGPAPKTDADLGDEAFKAVVAQLREEIARGEIYQVVPSRTFRAPCSDPLRVHGGLRSFETSPYRFYLSSPDLILFGASPETSVRLFREGGRRTVEVKPIAGTRPRGASPDEDDRMEAEMRLDAKEAAEHMMLVDLARNDVARISAAGSRRVARLMAVERYARVMHLVSSVTGTLANGYDALHALTACLNVGTLTGAPKLRATELLIAAERTRRGPYGGAVGWLNGAGLMDTAVVIRSAVVRDGTAYVRAGAGVVYDSDPQAEADETRRKASALLSVLAAAEAAQ